MYVWMNFTKRQGANIDHKVLAVDTRNVQCGDVGLEKVGSMIYKLTLFCAYP